MPSSDTHQNLVDYCYKHLKEAIIRGELAPGEKLQIAKLKKRLNAGPTPIREALSRLTSSGLIHAELNRGFFVKNISEEEVKDLYATFLKIELMALKLAMEKGDTVWEAHIIASLHKLSAVEKAPPPIDPLKWLDTNYEFHCSLIAGCKSPSLLKVREDLYQLFDRYCHLSLVLNQNSPALNHKDHGDIAKAVIERDKDRACQLMTLHLENSLAQVLSTLKKTKTLSQ